MELEFVDICVGLSWGDEGKGKIVSQLSKNKEYNFVCRWSGGNNAGHTIYVNGNKYATHLIPSGIFYGIPSIIGPGCVVNVRTFYEELEYLKNNGFDINLVKISPKAHIVMDKHIEEDINNYSKKYGTTSRGIGPCYKDKYARNGTRVCDISSEFNNYIWDEKLYGKVLCEGAQGFWLDIEYGNYPYVTSSHCLPHTACSLGFPIQKIRNIYGAIKIYDTRVGIDPEFPDTLNQDENLMLIAKTGQEWGTTTGRIRTVNYLNLNKLITALNISGTTHLIISKVDILEQIHIYKFYYKETLHTFESINAMIEQIQTILLEKCSILSKIIYSRHPDKI